MTIIHILTPPSSLCLASLVEGATGRTSPQFPSRSMAQGGASSPSAVTRQESTASEGWMLDNDEDPLPEGWEERQDANGRMFFVDHINHHTQWSRPTRSANVGAGQRRAQMESDRRRMMAQTLARRNPGMSGAEVRECWGGPGTEVSPSDHAYLCLLCGLQIAFRIYSTHFIQHGFPGGCDGLCSVCCVHLCACNRCMA